MSIFCRPTFLCTSNLTLLDERPRVNFLLMSSTVLRLGLWIILLVVALYVLQQTYEEAPFVDYFAPAMLQKALALGGLLVVAGIVLRLLEGGAKVVIKNRCIVCKTPIEHGAIYCRQHLRRVLSIEDDRTHRTRIRK